MTKSNAMNPALPVGVESLEDTPARVLKFLRAAGTSYAIRAALGSKGYSEEDHQEGWSLLHASSGYAAAPPVDAVDVVVRDAIRELDAWDEDGFRIVRASLERRFPKIAAMVLKGIGPSTGPAAVVGVATLLDRLDQLEAGGHEEARAALAVLAKRGVDKSERKRLRALVERAQSVGRIGGKSFEPPRNPAREKHLADLVALRGWFDEWSSIARAAIKRRDHLILLGLAKRKPRRRTSDAGAPAPTNGAEGESTRSA